MEDKALELARRMFVFSSLTGLAYVDLRNLYPHHIGMTADGRKYIREKRAKTNNEAFIPLHPIAEQIMSLYNTADDSKPVSLFLHVIPCGLNFIHSVWLWV